MPKKKGTPGGNPHPVQTPEFIRRKFPPAPDVPPGIELGQPIGVALPLEIDAVVRGLEKRSVWLRRVITEAAKRELLDIPDDSLRAGGISLRAGGISPAAEVLEVVNDLLAMPRLSVRVREGLTKIKTYLEENHD